MNVGCSFMVVMISSGRIKFFQGIWDLEDNMKEISNCLPLNQEK